MERRCQILPHNIKQLSTVLPSFERTSCYLFKVLLLEEVSLSLLHIVQVRATDAEDIGKGTHGHFVLLAFLGCEGNEGFSLWGLHENASFQGRMLSI